MEDHRFDRIEDLQRLCDEGADETTTLEFKPCNELKVGTQFYDNKQKNHRERTKDDVLNELTKDVTAFLNSAGGMLIYGIQENKSRANKLDFEHAFNEKTKHDNVHQEKVIDWLRSHIMPRPKLDVYRVFQFPGDPDSPWFLVINIPKGQTVYQARDLRFYRRTGPTAQPMELHEITDVMNRSIMPNAEVEFGFKPYSLQEASHEYQLDILVKNLGDKVIDSFKLQFKFPNYGDRYLHHPAHTSDPNFGTVKRHKDENGDEIVEFRSKDCLFPSDEFDVGSRVNFRYSIDDDARSMLVGYPRAGQARSYLFEWVLYADNMTAKRGEIPLSELQNF